jgi:hypothetical protein
MSVPIPIEELEVSIFDQKSNEEAFFSHHQKQPEPFLFLSILEVLANNKPLLLDTVALPASQQLADKHSDYRNLNVYFQGAWSQLGYMRTVPGLE